MILVVGLGNPGSEYVNTRHNVGYLFVDELLKNSKTRKLQESKQIKIFKSQSFMNESGKFISRILKTYNIKPETLYVVHDDLDIRLGEFKIQFGRGPKDHNGLKSIDETLGTNEYWHVRIGIDNRSNDNRPMGEEYVLQNFADEERKILDESIKRACRELIPLLF